ncbi:MAG: glutathione-disulfide reductase [Pseudomonadota bacterium]
MAEFDYDLFVIGGGSGGVRAARISAAEGGARVAIAEESRMGGTCVIRGCVPKKIMVFASSYPQHFADARAYGWELSQGGFDWSGFRERLHGELDRLEAAYRNTLTNAGVEIFDTRASIGDPHSVILADGRSISAKHILVATGGTPEFPDEAARECGISSDDVFHLDALPRRLLVIGGGYIACEFSCIFNGLGTSVTQYYRGAQVLRGFDDEARGLVAEIMRDKGVEVHLGTTIIEMERRGEEIWVKSSNGREACFDKVLFATGRSANTAGLGLEDAGVRLGRWGEISVDAFSQTNVPSIYAVGDVTNRINLTPVAIREGHAFADTVFGGKKRSMDHDLVPSAIFTQPEYGAVGLTEEQARETHRIDVYCTSFRPMQGAFIGRSERVLFKLIVDQETQRVLGCHIVAPNAGELIQLAGVAVKMGATKEDFDRTVAVHPTISEELVTMRTPVRSA